VRVRFGPEGRAEPYRRPIKVERSRLEAAGIDPGTTVEYPPDWEQVWLVPEVHGGWAGPTPVRLIAVAQWATDASAAGEVTSLEPTRALEALLASVVDPEQVAPPDLVNRCIGVIEGAEAITLRFGSATEAAETLWYRLVDAGAAAPHP